MHCLELEPVYDRILVNISSLIARGNGVHCNAILVHANTLQQANFKLKVEKEICNIFYQHCTAFPIHGTGQGSRNSPWINVPVHTGRVPVLSGSKLTRMWLRMYVVQLVPVLGDPKSLLLWLVSVGQQVFNQILEWFLVGTGTKATATEIQR